MPLIYKPEKAKKPNKKYNPKIDDLNHDAVYNTTTWRSLRIAYLQAHPLCERCLKVKKIVLATQVHHKIHLADAISFKDKQIIGFDWNNLESLCFLCHKIEHLKPTFDYDQHG